METSEAENTVRALVAHYSWAERLYPDNALWSDARRLVAWADDAEIMRVCFTEPDCARAVIRAARDLEQAGEPSLIVVAKHGT